MQTILVIDDDDAVRNSILLGLKSNGYRGLQGRSGDEGIEVAQRGGVDLILCDLNLGGLDERGTFRSLRECAASAGVPFIVMTGQPDQAVEGDDVLVKPFTLAALLEMLRNHLKEKPNRQEERQGSQKRRRIARKPPLAGPTCPPEESVLLPHKASAEDLEQILARVQCLREEERKQLARVIHDDLTQTLTVVAIELSLLENNLDFAPQRRNASDYIPTVKRLTGLVNDLIRSAQEITARLHPKVLDEFGLVAALEWLSGQAEQRIGVTCELRVEGSEEGLDPNLAAGLYRLCEEILSYAARHDRASAASIRVVRRAETLSMEIKHNGERLGSGEDEPGRLELLAIRERVERLGGQFRLTRLFGQGMATRVEIQV